MKFATLLHRPTDLCGRAVDPDLPGRGDRDVAVADQSVSGSRAAVGAGARPVSRRESEGDRRDRRRAARAGDQRRREHALHVLAGDQRRLDGADRHVPPRHRHRQRAGAGAEPRLAGAAASARGRAAHRRHDEEGLARPADGRAPHFARRPLRQRVPAQLRDAADPRRARAPARHGRGAHLRRRRLFHARLARSRSDRESRPDRERRRPRHP